MSEQWDESICNDRSGFLFNHACLQAPTGRCSTCNRPVCEEHTRLDRDELPLCITCAKKLLGTAGRHEHRGSSRTYGSHSHWNRHDPYFYGGYYYDGWGYYGPGFWGHRSYHSAVGHDRNDFTESDAHGLADDGDDFNGFESDMTES